MKAESVQRQHLQELRNIKVKSSPKSSGEVPTPERNRTARKSTNPHKHTTSSSSASPSISQSTADEKLPVKVDMDSTETKEKETVIPIGQEKDASADQESPVHDEAAEASNTNGNEKVEDVNSEAKSPSNPKEDPIIEKPSELPVTEDKDSTSDKDPEQQDAVSAAPEEASIDKVWETIRRDMTGVGSDDGEEDEQDSGDLKEEGEIDVFEDMMLVDEAPMSDSPEPPVLEEEEPSDWEDRDAGLEEDAPEPNEIDTNSKKMISECVLISSDDEGSPEKRENRTSTPIKNNAEDDEEEDERLQLDSSYEEKDTEAKVLDEEETAEEPFSVSTLLKEKTSSQNAIPEDKGADDSIAADIDAEADLVDPLPKENDQKDGEDSIIMDVEIVDDSAEVNPEDEVPMESESVNDEPEEPESDETKTSKPADDITEDTPEDVEHEEKELESVNQSTTDQISIEMVNSEKDPAEDIHSEIDKSELEVVESEPAELISLDSEENKPSEIKTMTVVIAETEDADLENIESSEKEHEDSGKENSDLVQIPNMELENVDSTDVENKEIEQKSEDVELVKPEQSKVEESEVGKSKPLEAPCDEVEMIDLEKVEPGSPIYVDKGSEKASTSAEGASTIEVTETVPSSKTAVEECTVNSVKTIVEPVEPAEAPSGLELPKSKDAEIQPDEVKDSQKSDEEITEVTRAPPNIPEVVELDTDSDSFNDSKDKDEIEKPDHPPKMDLLKTAVEVIKKDDNDKTKSVLNKGLDEAAFLEPLQVDLDALPGEVEPIQVDLDMQIDEGEPLQMDLDEGRKSESEVVDELMKDKNGEGNSDKSSRKRQLSEKSKSNHVNTYSVEQQKKAKLDSRLDLTDEPLEEALKQLDAISRKEKKAEDAPPRKLRLTKEILEELISRRITDHINNSQKSIIAQLKSRCDTLDKAVDKWRRKAQGLQSSVNELSAELEKHKKRPRGPTRTVGINVRISTTEPLRPLNPRLGQLTPKPPESPAQMKAIPLGGNAASSGGGPIPMHLVANTAVSPNKTFTSMAGTPGKPSGPTNTTASANPNASVKVIDLTDDDESAGVKNVVKQQQQQQQQQQQTQQQTPPQQSTHHLQQQLQQSSVQMTAARSTGNTMMTTNTVTRVPAPVTLQAPGGASIMGMPVMQLIPSVPSSGSGVTITGPRPPGPTVSLPPGLAPPGSRVTTYLVPSGPGGHQLRGQSQILSFPGQHGVMQTGTRPGAPMQTFLLRMNTVQTTAANSYATLTPTTGTPSVLSRGPPNVTLTARPSLPSPVTMTRGPIMNPSPRPPTPKAMNQTTNTVVTPMTQKHPALFPPQPTYTPNPHMKALPPKAALKISKVSNGIVLSWNLTMNSTHAEISKYQLFAYQEGNGPPLSSLWKKVGDVKALPLPMACTLTQFVEGNKYHFAVRAVDKHGRFGPFSDPSSILLTVK